MNDILEQSLLFDFYGELLTSRQKEIYELYLNDDLSLGEIADTAGISRQGVHDMIKRSSHTLQNYEKKLHLVARFVTIKKQINTLNELVADGPGSPQKIEQIKDISNQILGEL